MKINELLTSGKTGYGLDQATHGRLLKYQAPVTKGTLSLSGRAGTMSTAGRTGTLATTGRTPTLEVTE
jgi:hypothetical protein